MASPPFNTSVQGAPKNSAEGITMGPGDIPDTEPSDTETLSSDEESSFAQQQEIQPKPYYKGSTGGKAPRKHLLEPKLPSTDKRIRENDQEPSDPRIHFGQALVSTARCQIQFACGKVQHQKKAETERECEAIIWEWFHHLDNGLDKLGLSTKFNKELNKLREETMDRLLEYENPHPLPVAQCISFRTHPSDEVLANSHLDFCMERITGCANTEMNLEHYWHWKPDSARFEYAILLDMVPVKWRRDNTHGIFDLSLDEILEVRYDDTSRQVDITHQLKYDQSPAKMSAVFRWQGHKSLFIQLLRAKRFNVFRIQE